MKSLADDLEVKNERLKRHEKVQLINSSKGIDYWLFAVVLLSIVCLLFLVTVVVKYMKCRLKTPFLLSFCVMIENLVRQYRLTINSSSGCDKK